MKHTINRTEIEIEFILSEINQFLSNNAWFDFDILSANGHDMTIVGSTDLTQTCEIMITFHDIIYYQIPRSWSTEPENKVFALFKPTTNGDGRAVDVPLKEWHTVQIITQYNEREIFITARDISVSYEAKSIRDVIN